MDGRNPSEAIVCVPGLRDTADQCFATLNRDDAMAQLHDSQPPYKDLHIYYLKGRIAGDPITGDRSFIGNWQEEEDAFLFFKKPAEHLVRKILDRQPQLTLVDRFTMTYEEWQGGEPAPYRVGNLQVVPPWHARAKQSKDDAGTILLDPGVVFGTGTHPTTQDCLTAVQLAFENHSPRRVLDLGTGTGLLALAAARLGASRVVAVDFNGLAAATAQRNVRINGMEDTILVVQGDAKNFMDLPCDLVVSNIHYDVMRHLVTSPGFRTPKQFVLSGLLRSQAREIEHRLLQGKATILQTWDQNGIWHTFYGKQA